MEKKFLIRLVLIFTFCLSVFTSLYAKGKGTSGAIILSQPIGARASGMAEAYTAIEGEVCGIHYNPAGLAGLENKQVSFLYQQGFSEDKFGVLAFGYPIYLPSDLSTEGRNIGTLAGSFISYSVGDIELIDTSGNLRTVKAEQDYVATLSFSRSPVVGIKNLSLGINLKMIHSTLIEEFDTSAFAFDLGGLYKLIEDKLSLGLAVQNLGEELKYIDSGDSLPVTVRIGGAYRTNFGEDHKVIGALDVVKPNDDDFKENIGIEYWFRELLALRIGYRIGYDLDSMTFGLGYIFKNFGIDYGLAMMDELNEMHRVSFTIYF